MDVKRMVVVIALLWFLVTALVSPKPARANGTATALIIAGVVTGAYVAVVFVATAVHRQSRGPFELMPADTSPRRKQNEQGVQFGPRCAQKSTTLTLLCW
jgi:disulfide bond formation protein DsbB